ncbi:DUF4832 domain-containing protein [Cohnella phaseoli]|uniref:Uncharacterized protein DUF4832 n=1 Tax=Cohnella phaseoli TaxID=456490 RepID=A0A3D9HY87_9BACL|nr:DUF4832 domain-containing protein [Cohnella phaseoli]RED54472.1 uncharacterized protein DUF4832 [Cohnella phaseoli]
MGTCKIINARPKLIDDVLINPGIGFMTFQRFNGDKLNEGKGWTEGSPIVYQDFDGNLENENHPATTIAYFRVYWKYMEPEKGNYRWDLIDHAIATARQRKQTLLLRIAPYGANDKEDVPAWYREALGTPPPRFDDGPGWMVDPEDPTYAEHFGRFIRALGSRYDGHPDLESIDLSIVGSWGEGIGSNLLSQTAREALVSAYTDSFKETPLIMLLTDDKTNGFGLSQANVGWRVDCLGDVCGKAWDHVDDWSHMHDYYPQQLIRSGMQDAWQKAPVSLEVCWVIQHWKDKGWDVDYIIDQSLKWHISSFNAKSSPVPKEWEPHIDRWLKRMGYRLALRKFSFPEAVKPGGKLAFASWWENLGVAPCYKKFPLALRLKNDQYHKVFFTDANINQWLPGDSIYDNAIWIPADMPLGHYQFEIAILTPHTGQPAIQLANTGRQEDGWYALGNVEVQLELESPDVSEYWKLPF